MIVRGVLPIHYFFHRVIADHTPFERLPYYYLIHHPSIESFSKVLSQLDFCDYDTLLCACFDLSKSPFHFLLEDFNYFGINPEHVDKVLMDAFNRYLLKEAKRRSSMVELYPLDKIKKDLFYQYQEKLFACLKRSQEAPSFYLLNHFLFVIETISCPVFKITSLTLFHNLFNCSTHKGLLASNYHAYVKKLLVGISVVDNKEGDLFDQVHSQLYKLYGKNSLLQEFIYAYGPSKRSIDKSIHLWMREHWYGYYVCDKKKPINLEYLAGSVVDSYKKNLKRYGVDGSCTYEPMALTKALSEAVRDFKLTFFKYVIGEMGLVLLDPVILTDMLFTELDKNNLKQPHNKDDFYLLVDGDYSLFHLLNRYHKLCTGKEREERPWSTGHFLRSLFEPGFYDSEDPRCLQTNQTMDYLENMLLSRRDKKGNFPEVKVIQRELQLFKENPSVLSHALKFLTQLFNDHSLPVNLLNECGDLQNDVSVVLNTLNKINNLSTFRLIEGDGMRQGLKTTVFNRFVQAMSMIWGKITEAGRKFSKNYSGQPDSDKVLAPLKDFIDSCKRKPFNEKNFNLMSGEDINHVQERELNAIINKIPKGCFPFDLEIESPKRLAENDMDDGVQGVSVIQAKDPSELEDKLKKLLKEKYYFKAKFVHDPETNKNALVLSLLLCSNRKESYQEVGRLCTSPVSPFDPTLITSVKEDKRGIFKRKSQKPGGVIFRFSGKDSNHKGYSIDIGSAKVSVPYTNPSQWLPYYVDPDSDKSLMLPSFYGRHEIRVQERIVQPGQLFEIKLNEIDDPIILPGILLNALFFIQKDYIPLITIFDKNGDRALDSYDIIDILKSFQQNKTNLSGWTQCFWRYFIALTDHLSRSLLKNINEKMHQLPPCDIRDLWLQTIKDQLQLSLITEMCFSRVRQYNSIKDLLNSHLHYRITFRSIFPMIIHDHDAIFRGDERTNSPSFISSLIESEKDKSTLHKKIMKLLPQVNALLNSLNTDGSKLITSSSLDIFNAAFQTNNFLNLVLRELNQSFLDGKRKSIEDDEEDRSGKKMRPSDFFKSPSSAGGSGDILRRDP